MRKKMLFFFISMSCSLQLLAQSKLTIAVAANMQYTIQELITEFNKANKTKIDVVLGASGKLTQQVLNGAPFDIFISADKEFPQKLADNHFTLEPPKVYAQGLLVLWSVKPNIQPAKDLKLLVSPAIKSIAIANPKTAPYGSAAEAILKKYNLYAIISSKLVTGESITQTSQFIATRNADIGFTAKAIVISGEMKGKGKWVELNSADYPPIEQAAALLKHAKEANEGAAKQFYNFLYSAKAKAIYNKFGYIVK
ncbi:MULTISPECIES: molybdate ABC transporter substrate-binding protein [Niastella]|uniref:Molybdate ABC transporter substrate-binding protein n=1 Tax=Niastella soli TaxID=2821487 RepID=A0ABS3YWT6_9BACT|nr:molybdate ABC transporter substrate-binding protein [Niastella soli]MBO9201865.1 molybdate ABC transporter substrate-binding protein [Niastella soli]